MASGGARGRVGAVALAVGALVVSLVAMTALGPGISAAADRASTHRRTAPTSATVTITPALVGGTFTPGTVTVAKGGTLTVVNTTSIAHTFTSEALGSDGNPLFDVSVPAGATVSIPVSTLGGGSYSYYCRIHPSMTGTVIIDGPPDGQVTDVPKFEQPLV